MRKVSGLVGVTLLLAAPAFAADLGVRAPVVPLGPVPGWTGFYIGGNVGYGWGDQAVNFSGDPHTIGPLIGSGIVASSLASGPSGAIAGVQAGYNWQTGPFVLGIETDIDPRLSPRASPLRLSVLQRALIGSQTRTRSSTF